MTSTAIGWLLVAVSVVFGFISGGMFHEPYARWRASIMRVLLFFSTIMWCSFAYDRLDLSISSTTLWLLAVVVPASVGLLLSPALEKRWGFSWPFASKTNEH